MNGYIHSIQSFSTLDGPGIRSVVFLKGCPLRCVYCHNPDTWTQDDSQIMTAEDLVSKLKRFIPYIKDGGVTFSGGEPLLQADFISECCSILHKFNLTVAIDTSGAIYNGSVQKLLKQTDIALLDIKFTSNDDYKKYTGGSLDKVLFFLDMLRKNNIKTWIRHVVIPGINDRKDDILKLKEITDRYSVIEKIELLAFRKLCIEKYEKLNIKFPLSDTPELTHEKLKELQALLVN